MKFKQFLEIDSTDSKLRILLRFVAFVFCSELFVELINLMMVIYCIYEVAHEKKFSHLCSCCSQILSAYIYLYEKIICSLNRHRRNEKV